MNTVTATHFRRHVEDVLETAQTQPVCVTRYGKSQLAHLACSLAHDNRLRTDPLAHEGLV